MTLPRLSRPAAIVVAVALALGAELAKAWLADSSGRDLGFVLAWFAVVVASLLGGLAPGLVCVILVALIDAWLRVGASGAQLDRLDELRLTIFLVAGVGAAYLVDLVLGSRSEAEAARDTERAARLDAEAAMIRATALTALAAAVNAGLSVEEVASAALSGITGATGARTAGIFVLEGHAARAVALHGSVDGIRTGSVMAIGPAAPEVSVARSGVADYRSGEREAAPGEVPPLLSGGQPAPHAVAIIPMQMDGHAVGVLELDAAPPGVLDAEERAFLGAVASLTAHGMDRAHLLGAQENTLRALDGERRRLRALQGLTSRLSRSATGQDIAVALAERGRVAAGARAIAVALIRDDGALVVEAVRGVTEETPLEGLRPGSVATGPLADVAARGQPVFLDDRLEEGSGAASEQVSVSRPAHGDGTPASDGLPPDGLSPVGLLPGDRTRGAPRPEGEQVRLAVLPMLARGTPVGVVAWVLERAHPLGERERGFLRVVAGYGAQALERAIAAAREQEARDRAAGSRRQLDVVAATSGLLLGTSVDYEDTLLELMRAAIPLLGDYCVVDVIELDRVRRLVAALDGGREAVVEVLEGRPVDLASASPIAEAIRTRTAIVRDVDDALLETVARDADHLAAGRQSGWRQVMAVPLLVGDTAMGSLTFAHTDPDRRYDETDLAVCQVLAQRAVRTVENAQLHRQLRQLAVHERERAAELESVVGAIGEGIVLLDGSGQVRSQNASAHRMLGGPVATIAELSDRLGADVPLPPPGVAYGPIEHQLVTGSRGWLEVTAYPIGAGDGEARSGVARPSAPRSGAARATVLVLRDVTAFRQGQGLREAFMGLLSHELRTPVTSIYAAANVLGRRHATLDDATRQDILADIVAESDRLFRLIEDLLILARFDEGLELLGEPQLLQRIVPSVVDAERTRWSHLEFRVSSAADLPAVAGDETSIQQVVRNFVSNAAKYGPLDRPIDIRIAPQGDGVAVHVLDRGPGVRAEEVDQLFTPFFRSPRTAAIASGAGIGLFVCRRLVDAMSGRVWAAPRAGGGSDFGFWLPRYQSIAEELEASVAGDGNDLL